jgi:hypothetical protein
MNWIYKQLKQTFLSRVLKCVDKGVFILALKVILEEGDVALKGGKHVKISLILMKLLILKTNT